MSIRRKKNEIIYCIYMKIEIYSVYSYIDSSHNGIYELFGNYRGSLICTSL